MSETLIDPGKKAKFLYESVLDSEGNSKKRLKIYGTAVVCDVTGINGRSYPKRILEPEVKRFNEEFIKTGRAAAQLNHPRVDQDGNGKDYSVYEMNLMKTCALIEDMHFEGNNLMCKMVVVEGHPAGDALTALLKAGYVPGYSLRGSGSVVSAANGFEITDDYHLITVDVVGNPSFDAKALVTPMYESIDGGAKEKALMESISQIQQEIIASHAQKPLMAGAKDYNVDTLASVLMSNIHMF